MDSGSTPPVENMNVDVVIAGAGGAGIAAAVAASERGMRVVLLEKRSGIGGNSVFAEGFFAAESPTQQRMMIDARRDALFKTAMDYAHYTINPRIVRAFIDKSGDTVRWLEEKGLKIDRIPALYLNQVPQTWHCLEKGGRTVVKLLRKECDDRGVRLLNKTSVSKLLTGEKGEITAIVVTSEGKEFTIRTKSVVIATGGYAGNKKMLKKYCPFYAGTFISAGLPHTGDGIRMAIDVGADTEGLGILHMAGPNCASTDKSRARMHIGTVAQEPNTLWVNGMGERFIDESTGYNPFECVNAMLRQPGNVSYSLFDERLKTNIIEKGLIKGLGILYVPPLSKLSKLDEELRLYAGKGVVKIADSWDKIAVWMGAEPAVLKATVDEYNTCCDGGYDDIFAKERRYLMPLLKPPYYAIKCYPEFLGTIGGIKVNHNMEVLNSSGKPISGLYAAGTDVGGWESHTYCAVLAGSTYGFALNSGRIAGENAAEYAAGMKIKQTKV